MTAFLTVFLSVFIAELGDKTQLATVLFASEDGRSKWLVFLASSAALVTSAALATLAGSALRDYLGGPWLKIAAGAGFIAIGVWILWRALRAG